MLEESGEGLAISRVSRRWLGCINEVGNLGKHIKDSV